MAVSCLLPAETGCDFALPTAKVRYSSRASSGKSKLEVKMSIAISIETRMIDLLYGLC